MITMTTVVAPAHSTRVWVESVAFDVPVTKQRPSTVTLGGIDFYNSTGVSVVRRRHR